MEEFERLNRELKYQGVIVGMYEDTIRTPGGKITHWDFVHHDGAAAVVPVTEDGRILMIRQYRNAIDRMTLEIPAGKLNGPDEPGIACAGRELEEETGYRSDNLEYLISLNSSVAICDELIEIYTAHDLVPACQHLDENEYVDVIPCDIDELCRMIYDGELKDSKTVAGLLAYRLRYCGK